MLCIFQKLDLPEKIEPDANSKNLVHSILDKKFDSKLKKSIYRVRWESKPKYVENPRK